MDHLKPEDYVQLAAIVAYTVTAAISDIRTRKIPNKLTVPMFAAGFFWQVWAHGPGGLLDGLLGFATGFGIMFVLWMIGTAGGGDVKLLGGLSVWLAPRQILMVLFVSLIFVVVGTCCIVLWSVVSRGFGRTRTHYLKRSDGTGKSETTEQRQKRRVMAFAMPVALATWCVLVLFLFQR